MYKIPVYQPYLSGNEKKYVNKCLDTNWISSKGKFITEFENEFCKYTNIKHSTSVCNGTIALHLALLALGIKPENEVIVPTLTYIASVNAIKYTGATPVFVDSLEETWQIDYIDVQNKITPKTRSIIAVHLYGHPCEMDMLTKIAEDNNLFLVEDCAEAFGSLYKGKHTGTFGDIATFSFYGNKTITTGEGGMVSTNNNILIEKAKHLKFQGVSQNSYYWHDIVGYNYRMTNICAAIGLAQLENADKVIERKIQLAKMYQERLKNLPIIFHPELDYVKNSYWMVSILLNDQIERDNLMKTLKESGIETRPFFDPIHKMPMYYREDNYFPVAESLSKRGINLPSWPQMSTSQIDFICEEIRRFFR